MDEELRAVLSLEFADAESLYERCYTTDCRFAGESIADGAEDLSAVLAAANRSRDRWDDGWKVVQPLDEGWVLASSGAAARGFRPGQYVTLRGPGPIPEKGEAIRVFQPAGTCDIQAGFYFAFGETVCEFDEFEDLLRLYWNISQEGAPLLMAAITGEFNRFSVPFRFKCGQRPGMYRRRDPAVLYIGRTYYAIAAQLAERIHEQLAGHLRDSVPLFTRRLARGLGFAEDPGQSFGHARCAILAVAMTATRGCPVQERLRALRDAFESRGLSLERPWLNSCSNPVHYPFPFRGV